MICLLQMQLKILKRYYNKIRFYQMLKIINKTLIFWVVEFCRND